jgi:cytochrome c biogenesis protein CcdA
MVLQFSSLFDAFTSGFVAFIIASIIYLFSPLNILFIVSSIVRGKAISANVRKAAFVFQIILLILGIVIGILALFVLFSFMYGSIRYHQSSFIGAALGIIFIFALQLGAVIWESVWLKRKNSQNLI